MSLILKHVCHQAQYKPSGFYMCQLNMFSHKWENYQGWLIRSLVGDALCLKHGRMESSGCSIRDKVTTCKRKETILEIISNSANMLVLNMILQAFTMYFVALTIDGKT